MGELNQAVDKRPIVEVSHRELVIVAAFRMVASVEVGLAVAGPRRIIEVAAAARVEAALAVGRLAGARFAAWVGLASVGPA